VDGKSLVFVLSSVAIAIAAASAADVEKVLGLNLLRVMRAVETTAKGGQS
jgi:hypothetical protein